MSIYNYYDIIINVEIITKLNYVIYLFFVKGSFLLYFTFVMFCQFNVYIYLLAYNFFVPNILIVNLINVEFTFIQFLHILLKLLKVYVYVFILFTLINNIKIFKFSKSYSMLLFFLLVYLYLLTGSFWSWLEPSWSSWWFGEDVEELLIFVIFLQFVILSHYLNKNYYMKILCIYSFLLLSLGYLGNLIIFTSRHKTLSYYSIINLNFWLILFFFSLQITKSKINWYIFKFLLKYNWNSVVLISKNIKKLNHYYVYLFDSFIFFLFVIYEFPIFCKFISYYINLHFFMLNMSNNDLLYIIILSFFTLISKIKLFYFYLLFVLDWDIFLNSILFLNANLVWNLHFSFVFIYLIDTTLEYSVFNQIAVFGGLLDLLKLVLLNNFYLDYNLNWIYEDNIFNIDNLQFVLGRDLMYFFFIFSLVFFFSWKLI